MSLDTALHDLTLASNLNKMYSLINSLSCRQRYFAADSPTISKIDTITSVVYTAPNHEVHGSSYHIQGSLHDVVTMIRRVNQEYHYSDQYQKGNLEKLESSIIRAGNIYSGQVVVVAKTGKMEHMGDGVPEVEVSPKNQENIEMNQGKEGIEINQRKRERRVREAAIMASVMEKHASQEYHSTGIAPAEKEEREVYHGTTIAPAEKEEREVYHGTTIAPAEREEREVYHSTGIAPAEREEREVYHGTTIAPAEKEEKEAYYGTLIPPVEDPLQPQITSWESRPFDINQYIGHNEWNGSLDDPKLESKKPYVPLAKRRHDELHKRPDHRVTWEEIRRRFIVCYKQLVK